MNHPLFIFIFILWSMNHLTVIKQQILHNLLYSEGFFCEAKGACVCLYAFSIDRGEVIDLQQCDNYTHNIH